RLGRGRGGAGEQDGELLTAVPADHVRPAQRTGQAAGDLADHRVADQVAVGVVDPLEVVDVDHDRGDRLGGAGGSAQVPPTDLEEVATVEQAGQRVPVGEILDLLEKQRVVQR